MELGRWHKKGANTAMQTRVRALSPHLGVDIHSAALADFQPAHVAGNQEAVLETVVAVRVYTCTRTRTHTHTHTHTHKFVGHEMRQA